MFKKFKSTVDKENMNPQQCMSSSRVPDDDKQKPLKVKANMVRSGHQSHKAAKAVMMDSNLSKLNEMCDSNMDEKQHKKRRERGGKNRNQRR